MSLPALGTYTTICFNLRAREDIEVMEAALNLDGDKDFISKLRTGQAIVKLQDRILKPFLVKFPKMSQDSPSNLKIYPEARKMLREFFLSSRILAIPQKSPNTFRDSCSRAVILPKSDILARNSSTTGGILPRNTGIRPFSEPDKVITKLKNPQNLLLIDIFQHPFTPIAQRYRQLKLYADKGNRLKNELLSKKLIQEVRINAGNQRLKLYEITELGKQQLRDNGIDTEKGNRRGGIEHQYWCGKAKELYEKVGYGTLEEISLGKGKTVDIVAVKENQKIAIEIETGKSDYIGNIKKCLEEDFEIIVIIATSEKVKKKIQSKIVIDENPEPIIIVTGSEFVKMMNIKLNG